MLASFPETVYRLLLAVRGPATRKRIRLVWALLGTVVLGCHGRGPVGAEADAVYVAAYGYLIQYRTHFFPVAVDQVCLDGPDGRRMA